MYLPKSKYQTGYTPGGEYEIISTEQDYRGAYFKTHTGQFFTGNAPSRKSQELRLVNKDTGFISGQDDGEGTTLGLNNDNGPFLLFRERYDILRKDNKEYELRSTVPVKVYYPKPTPSDYKRGILERYFALDKTTGQILEISLETYRSMKMEEPKYYFPKYTLGTVKWSLTSFIKNESTIAKANTSLPGISSYLKDAKQFIGNRLVY